MTKAEIVASAPCPRCGAAAGEPCRGQWAVHADRKGRAEMLSIWRKFGLPALDQAERERFRRGR